MRLWRRPAEPGFPLTAGELEGYRLAAHRRLPAGQVGAHLRRRQGQSLEFREYRAYVPGDDVRHVDWLASARTGRPHDYVVKTFTAEERLTLAVSVDTRATMGWPAALPKRRVAAWLARALATVAGRSGDRALLHRLFGGPAAVVESAGGAPSGAARRWLDGLDGLATAADPPRPNLDALMARLKPTAVWVVVTDLYFDDPGGSFARALARLQEGHRWIVLVELDSWPMERALLGLGPALVAAPGGRDKRRSRVTLDAAQAERVEADIRRHTESLWQPARRGGLTHVRWPWPADPAADAGDFFRRAFTGDRDLQRLFRRPA
jgi:uncharacterized protein (DUF58 family)